MALLGVKGFRPVQTLLEHTFPNETKMTRHKTFIEFVQMKRLTKIIKRHYKNKIQKRSYIEYGALSAIEDTIAC